MYSKPALSMVTNVQKSGENLMYFPNVPFSRTVFRCVPSVFHHCVVCVCIIICIHMSLNVCVVCTCMYVQFVCVECVGCMHMNVCGVCMCAGSSVHATSYIPVKFP